MLWFSLLWLGLVLWGVIAGLRAVGAPCGWRLRVARVPARRSVRQSLRHRGLPAFAGPLPMPTPRVVSRAGPPGRPPT